MKLLLLIRLQQDRNGRIFDQSLRRKTKSLGYIEKESAVCCLEKRSLYQSSLYKSYMCCLPVYYRFTGSYCTPVVGQNSI